MFSAKARRHYEYFNPNSIKGSQYHPENAGQLGRSLYTFSSPSRGNTSVHIYIYNYRVFFIDIWCFKEVVKFERSIWKIVPYSVKSGSSFNNFYLFISYLCFALPFCFLFGKFSKMARYDMTGIGINLREVPDDNGSMKIKVLGLLLDGPAHSAGIRQVTEVQLLV